MTHNWRMHQAEAFHGLPSPAEAGSQRVAVCGHEHASSRLLAHARAGRPAQAYLMVGPPAIGKRLLARLTAQALLCTAEPAVRRPCGECRACRLVRQDGHPDCHWILEPLRVDAVRDLRSLLSLAPAEAAWRLAILADLDQATTAALNALLKTLEEPPPHAVLLLTAADLDAVLPTVRSRCHIIRLRPLARALVVRCLVEGWGADAEQAELLARLSGGRLGWAVTALTDRSVLERREAWLGAMDRALDAGVDGRLQLAAELVREDGALTEGLRTWVSLWRDVLLVQHGLEAVVVNRDRLARVRELAGRFPVPQAIASLRNLEDILQRLAGNAQPQLALEVLLLELPS